MHHRMFMSGGSSVFTVDAAQFDAGDVVKRTTALSGAPSSKQGIYSCWFNTANAYFLLGTTVSGSFSYVSTTTVPNQAQIQMGPTLTAQTNNSSWSNNTWTHILAAWDGATGQKQLYINDVSNIDGTGSINNTTSDWSTTTNFWIGADFGGGTNFVGGMAEAYLIIGSTLDMTTVSNRRRFISGTGKPVSLGATGSLPTGTTPLLYLHLDDGEAAANFATNRAGNGDFTITAGALTTFASSPSD